MRIRTELWPPLYMDVYWRWLPEAVRRRNMVQLEHHQTGIPMTLHFVGQQTRAKRPVRRRNRLYRFFDRATEHAITLFGGAVAVAWDGDFDRPEIVVVIPERELRVLDIYCRARQLGIYIEALRDHRPYRQPEIRLG